MFYLKFEFLDRSWEEHVKVVEVMQNCCLFRAYASHSQGVILCVARIQVCI